MAKRTETMWVSLPRELVDEMKAIAKLAGLSVETVIRVAIATEFRRHARIAAGERETDVMTDYDYARDTRTCTCHPDDNPPKPCARKYAYSECSKVPPNARIKPLCCGRPHVPSQDEAQLA